jgi:hypothetical protein
MLNQGTTKIAAAASVHYAAGNQFSWVHWVTSSIIVAAHAASIGPWIGPQGAA